jgi:hypothetical protein
VKAFLGGNLPAYDGRKSLYTPGSFPFESEKFTVTLVDPEKKDKKRSALIFSLVNFYNLTNLCISCYLLNPSAFAGL